MLSKDQQKAVSSSSDAILLLACAGSGKTTTLVARVARLITSGIASPENIAAITFTNLAADELSYRLGQQIAEKAAVSQMFIGTIHSFCLHLLQDFSGTDGLELTVLTENQRLALLDSRWKDWQIGEISPESTRTDIILRLATTLDIIRLDDIAKETVADISPSLANVAEQYEKYLRDNRTLDFAGLLDAARRKLIAESWFRDSVRSRFKYLFVDEYQDVDPAQHFILTEIAHGQSFFVVGDDDQAIYQFRGTNVKHFLEMRRSVDNLEEISLLENRRCATSILDLAQGIISVNGNRVDKPMRATRSGGRVILKRFDSIIEEAAYIGDEVERLANRVGSGSYGDIAILLRSVASYGDLYLEELKRRGIPYVTKGDRAMFSRDEVLAIVSCLRFISEGDKPDVTFLQVILQARGNVGNIEHIYDAMDPSQWHVAGFSASDYALFTELLNLRDRYTYRKYASLLEIVYDVIATLSLVSASRGEDVLYNVAMLTQLVSEFEEVASTKDLRRLCIFLTTFASRRTDDATPLEASTDAVRVLTIHQAKGLEFDTVFCPMLVERRFPSVGGSDRWLLPDTVFDADRYRTNIDDERRLFYVAATRARNRLYLLSSENIGLKKPVRASVFFEEAKQYDRVVADVHTTETLERGRKNEQPPLATSYSAMEYYLSCPYRYMLRYVYGFETPTNPFFEFGRIVHNSLAVMHKEYQSKGHLSQSEVERIYSDRFRISYQVPSYVIEKRRRAGLEALKRYCEDHTDWLERTVDVETPFAHFAENALIRGRIDLVVQNGEGLEIVDFKTGQPTGILSHDFQMQVYSLASISHLHTKVDRATVLYVETGEAVEFEVDEDFLNSGQAQLTRIVRRMSNGEFEAKPGKVCSRCEFREVCDFRAT